MIPGYRLHQLQGNQIYGFRKSGYLLKKSEGKMRVKAWRKRRCEITDGFLFIYHSDETQPPTKLNLLTCQVKLVPGKEKKCFDLISFNRTYHFQVEDEHDITAWVHVLVNCKEGALKRQFDDSRDIVDFATPLQQQVQALTGNDRCVDCSTDRPTWLSTNLGVLVCIECSGIHRDLGVHISRIQSLTLDDIKTHHLLIAHNMGNDFFNEIYESKLRQLDTDTPRLQPNSSMEQRCKFIKAKYVQKKFCQNIHRDDTERHRCLKEAVITKDLRKLVQLFGEGFDIGSCISNDDLSLPIINDQDTSIHLALSCQASLECDLYILDFIIQNSRAINRQNALGETPLHYCAKYNLPECMKLLLRSGADVNLRNKNNETPLDLVQKRGYEFLVEILGGGSDSEDTQRGLLVSDYLAFGSGPPL